MQENVLEITVNDEDVITSDDLIGRVIIDLSSLLGRENNQNSKCWFPIYDLALGIRGELLVEVKLTFVRDENVAKAISTTLVSFFSCSSPPMCLVKNIVGFVEELVDFKKNDKESENMILI